MLSFYRKSTHYKGFRVSTVVEYYRTMQISSELTNLVVYLVRDEYHATLFLLANKHI